MIDQTVTELASESLGVAADFYTAFETPITFILGIIAVGIIFTMIIRAFAKQ